MDDQLPVFVTARKDLLVGVNWQSADSAGEMQFVAPLAIGGRTIRGLWLRGSCYETYPHEAVMFQLEVSRDGVRTRTPLSRIDWRPLQQPHKNGPHKDPLHSRTVVWGSHIHGFAANWVAEKGVMRAGNLPYALEIAPDPRGYDDLIDFVAKQFRINGLDKIERPLWMQRLL